MVLAMMMTAAARSSSLHSSLAQQPHPARIVVMDLYASLACLWCHLCPSYPCCMLLLLQLLLLPVNCSKRQWTSGPAAMSTR
jgi:hypothetical protein